MVFKDGEGDELVLVLELLLVDDFVKQSCDMFRRIVEGTATECTEHDAVVSVQQTDTQRRPHFVLCQCGIFFTDVPISI